MEAFVSGDVPWEPVANHRSGEVYRKFLREGELAPGVGFTADLVKFSEGDGAFIAPRHRHDYDQFRLTLEGCPDYGRDVLAPAGQVAYFPAGAHYGPERIEGGSILQVQWSHSWVTRQQYDEMRDQLSQTGRFEEGSYISVDDTGTEQRADAANAVIEAVKRKRFGVEALAFPTPRYPQPLVMNPDAFAWRPDGNGLSTKVLGRYTENDVYASKHRWDDDDATLVLSAERTQLLWISAGSVRIGDASYGPETAIWSAYDEITNVVGGAGAEAVCFGFPIA
ncbi:hypothetical protein ABT297_09600 [Dactylosporangium sp. NPDC000555]|uniref:hypothetical protein n=1 Tax=Dactylosporangium sp. NPDC000555 TaxID=3154260 RepID=UPI00332E03B3